jgi:hypothetical protein
LATVFAMPLSGDTQACAERGRHIKKESGNCVNSAVFSRFFILKKRRWKPRESA